MLTLALFILFTAVTLPSVYFTPAILTRVTVLTFFTVAALVANAYNYGGVGFDLSLYSGLIDLTGFSTFAPSLHTFWCVLVELLCNALFWVILVFIFMVIAICLTFKSSWALLTLINPSYTSYAVKELSKINWNLVFFILNNPCIYVDHRALRYISRNGEICWSNFTIQYCIVEGKSVPVLVCSLFIQSNKPLNLTLWVFSSSGRNLYPIDHIPTGHTIISLGSLARFFARYLERHEYGFSTNPATSPILGHALQQLLSGVTTSDNSASDNPYNICFVGIDDEDVTIDSDNVVKSTTSDSSSNFTSDNCSMDTELKDSTNKNKTLSFISSIQEFWAKVYAKDDGGPTDNVFLLAKRAIKNNTPITAELINKLQNYSQDEKLNDEQVKEIMAAIEKRENWGCLKGLPLKGTTSEIFKGIYIVTHIETGAIYVGSAKNILKRLEHHSNGYDPSSSLSRLVRSLKSKGGGSLFNAEVVIIPMETPLYMLHAYEQIAMLMLKASINVLLIASSPQRFTSPSGLLGKQVFMYEDNVLRYVFDNQMSVGAHLGMAPTFALRTIKNGGQYGHTPLHFSSIALPGTTEALLNKEEVRILFDTMQNKHRIKRGPGIPCHAVKGDITLKAFSAENMSKLIAEYTGKPMSQITVTKHMNSGTIYRGFRIYRG